MAFLMAYAAINRSIEGQQEVIANYYIKKEVL